jgi:hypothetical protein
LIASFNNDISDLYESQINILDANGLGVWNV